MTTSESMIGAAFFLDVCLRGLRDKTCPMHPCCCMRSVIRSFTRMVISMVGMIWLLNPGK
jgi:hypothetical protein